VRSGFVFLKDAPHLNGFSHLSQNRQNGTIILKTGRFPKNRGRSISPGLFCRALSPKRPGFLARDLPKESKTEFRAPFFAWGQKQIQETRMRLMFLSKGNTPVRFLFNFCRTFTLKKYPI